MAFNNIVALLVLGLFAVTLAQTPQPGPVPQDPDKCQCVFKTGVTQAQKQVALDYVCGNLNCADISPGGQDYYPNTIESHSSWAINAWYMHNSNQPQQACNFQSTARLMCSTCHCTLTEEGMSNATTLKSMTMWVCNQPNFDCSPIRQGGDKYLPNTPQDHAAWAVDTWYQEHYWTYEGCQFGGNTILAPADCIRGKK